MAPERVRAYVVRHEVVHLAIPNHSRAFWAEMARVDPGHPEAKDWLRRHGEELRRVDVADALAQPGPGRRRERR
jgi:predicted metal-dependent hydrolase